MFHIRNFIFLLLHLTCFVYSTIGVGKYNGLLNTKISKEDLNEIFEVEFGKNYQLLDYSHDASSLDHRKLSRGDKEDLCSSYTKCIFPSMVLIKDGGKPIFIVDENKGGVATNCTGGFLVEICSSKPGAYCKHNESFPPNLTLKCEQKHIKMKMNAYDEDRQELVHGPIPVPCCCQCVVTKEHSDDSSPTLRDVDTTKTTPDILDVGFKLKVVVYGNSTTNSATSDDAFDFTACFLIIVLSMLFICLMALLIIRLCYSKLSYTPQMGFSYFGSIRRGYEGEILMEIDEEEGR
uniref:Spaetzle domain-containing protein n=1 Tax=Cacopsylla melanoneura TaxID=428564 RepID=A0A8D9F2Q6_9HEMI